MALKIIAANSGHSESAHKTSRKSDVESIDNSELKVTKIAQQVKRHDRYSIYINEKYSFSLHEYQLATAGLKIGKVLSENELKEFANESQFGKAYERALNYVMIRPRSEKEIIDYLTRTFLYPRPKMHIDTSGQRHIIPRTVDKEATSRVIERVMDRLREKHYLDNASFAKAWVASRQFNKKSSKRKLEQELRVKGISSDIIATVLQNPDIDEKENLQAIITKKRRMLKYHDVTKLMQYLARQGFSYDDIKEALKQDTDI